MDFYPPGTKFLPDIPGENDIGPAFACGGVDDGIEFILVLYFGFPILARCLWFLPLGGPLPFWQLLKNNSYFFCTRCRAKPASSRWR